MARPRTKQHYVDNEKFLVVMGEYREEWLKNIDAGGSNIIAKQILEWKWKI